VEFTLWQASPTWDSHASVTHKFEEAREQSTCVETHALRRIHRMRALPPSREHLMEVRRIVLGWLDQLSPQSQQQEQWPQIPPAGFITSQGFSHELRNLHTKLQARNPQIPKHLLDSALRTVDPQESLAIADLPPQSQWLRYDRALAASHIKSQAAAEACDEDDAAHAVRAEDPSSRAESIERLRTLKGELQPVLFPTLHSQLSPIAPLVLAQQPQALHDSDFIVLL
jgi:hypothetical protein